MTSRNPSIEQGTRRDLGGFAFEEDIRPRTRRVQLKIHSVMGCALQVGCSSLKQEAASPAPGTWAIAT